jgi:hypothetical protein
MSAIVNPRQWQGPGPLRAVVPLKKNVSKQPPTDRNIRNLASTALWVYHSRKIFYRDECCINPAHVGGPRRRRQTRVLLCMGRRRVCMWSGKPQHPVNTSDNVDEESAWVHDSSATLRSEHVFGKIVNVMCLVVVGVQRDLDMFPCPLYGVAVCPGVLVHIA